MKVGAVAIAVLLILIGGTFAGQGLGYIRGSVMTGDPKWIWIGGGMVIVGLVAGGRALFYKRA
jgi:hypothetical protein